jgi:phage terminase small subunit
MTKSLTPKQQRFADEYLVDLNACQAAIRAGYSPRSARSQGYRLLTNDDIQELIQKGAAERSKRCEVDADRVLTEAARLAFSDMRDFISWGPNGVTLRPSDELSDDAAACISEIVETRTKDGARTIRFKLHDKKGSLELVGKHAKINAFKPTDDGAMPIDNNWTITFVSTTKDEYDRSRREKAIEHKP